MPAVTIRRLQAVGRSLTVSLPKDWVVYNQLGQSDEVELVYDGDIRIRALKKQPLKEKVAAGEEIAQQPKLTKPPEANPKVVSSR